MRFWIVNVFVRPSADGTVPPQAGNPLAVVECPTGALTTAQMQAIAFEFGYSETTFVAPRPEAGAWPTRIFTPTSELPFAGHPTLGTAHVLRRHVSPSDEPVTLRLAAGEVRVKFEAEGRGVLTAPPVSLVHCPEAADVARDWSFDAALIDPRTPVAVYGAGPTPTLVPLRSVEILEAFEPPRCGPHSLYIVARDEMSGVIRVRLFAPDHGVPEDPATGSAACCLGRYLLDFPDFAPGASDGVAVHQGQEMGRPSLLHLRAERTELGDRIEVGGMISDFAGGALA